VFRESRQGQKVSLEERLAILQMPWAFGHPAVVLLSEYFKIGKNQLHFWRCYMFIFPTN
jgi:hypothetical protein